MFGREYASHPEILFDSFTKMKDEYMKKSPYIEKSKFVKFLISQYIKLFGVPEIGIQVRFMHFKKLLNLYFPKRLKEILDAGSGIGGYVLELYKKYPKAHITGGEIDSKKIFFSKRLFSEIRAEKIKFQKMDIVRSKLTKRKYDLIVNIDVLEHIRSYKKVLKNFSNALKLNGYLFIHTPHKDQKRIFSFTRGWYHTDHVREGFLLDSLSKELEKNNLHVIYAKRIFGLFGRFSWELNHFFLEKSFILAGLTYPLLYLVAQLDLYFTDSQGLGIILIARKV